MRVRRLRAQPRWLLLCLIFGGYILSPRLDFGVPVHVGLLSLLALLVMGLPFTREMASNLHLLRGAFFLVAIALYHMIFASAYGNSFGDFALICVSCVLYLAFGFVLARYLQSRVVSQLDVLHLVAMLYVLVMFGNSVLIVVEYAVPPFKAVVEAYLQQDLSSNIPYADHPFRVRGLAAGGGAGLSVANAAAVWVCIALWRRNLFSIGFTMLVVATITASNIFTGRTGLVLSLMMAVGFVFLLLRDALILGRLSFRSVTGIGLAVAVAIVAAGQITLSDEVVSWAFEWGSGFLSGDGDVSTQSTDDLRSMLFLPDRLDHLLLGVGFFEGLGSIYPRTDSGYLKTLLSIGAPLALALYGWILYSLLRLRSFAVGGSFLIVPLVLMVALIEIKEPFIYQNSLGRFVMTLVGVCIALSASGRTVPGQEPANGSLSLARVSVR